MSDIDENDYQRELYQVFEELNRYWQANFTLPNRYPRKGKKINDPVYQTIHIEPAIRTLVDLPVFQRLRYIKHLGLTYFVYPTANHTRFDHSLGVYHVLTKFLENFERTKDEYYGFNEQLHDFTPGALNKNLFLHMKIAAILHDIGHLPFSHATESLFSGINFPEMGTNKYPTSSVHEYFTCKILETDYLRGALVMISENEGMKVDPDFIKILITGNASQATPETRWAVQLINGDLDVDKIDYLIRDSHFTGVPYGTIDLSRIILMFRVKREGDSLTLFGNKRGLTAFESLLIARLFMFSSVYHHHAKIAAEELFNRIAREYFAQDGKNLCALVGLTDYQLCGLIDSDSRYQTPFRQLFARKLPKLLVELDAHEMKKRDWVFKGSAQDCRQMELELAARLGKAGLLPEGKDIPHPVILYFSKPRKAAPLFRFYLQEDEAAFIKDFSNIIKDTTGLQRIGYVFVQPELYADDNQRDEILSEVISYLDEDLRFTR